MEHRRRRRNANRYNPTILLLGLVLVLAVVLVIVLCIAFGGGSQTPPGTPPNATTPVPGATTTTPKETTVPRELEIMEPKENSLVSLVPQFTFAGTSDPNQSLTVNGQEVIRDADGNFTMEVTLQSGMNEFTFAYLGQTQVYTVEYRTVVQSFFPSNAETFNSGATITFELFVREGSSVEVTFNGKTIEMKKSNNQAGSGAVEGFELYTGTYTLTGTNTSDLELGSVTFIATCNGVTETYTSGNITCLKAPELDGWDEEATPDGGN